jgi:hypothetical protein
MLAECRCSSLLLMLLTNLQLPDCYCKREKSAQNQRFPLVVADSVPRLTTCTVAVCCAVTFARRAFSSTKAHSKASLSASYGLDLGRERSLCCEPRKLREFWGLFGGLRLKRRVVTLRKHRHRPIEPLVLSHWAVGNSASLVPCRSGG